MSKVTIEANGHELDLAKGIGFGLNYAIDDIKKPEKRNGNYSKTITLAGSKNNNNFFGKLFDVNSDFTFFNPNIKTAARIVIDSSTVLDGFLRLNAIEKESNNMLSGNNIVYKCTVFSKAPDFFTDIKDKKLNELDFSRYNHEYSYTNIVNSWSNSYEQVYTYPLLYNGRADNTYPTRDFKPCLFYKAYLKRIAQEAGYTLSGGLLDDSTDEGLAFSKEIIPFSGEAVVLPDAEHDRRLFKAGMSAVDYDVYNGLVTDDLSIAETAYTFIDDDSTGGNFDNDNHYDTTLNKYTVDANGNYTLKTRVNLEQTFTSKRDVDITQAGASAIFITFANPHGYTTNGNLTGTISGTTDYDGTYVSITVVDSVTLRYTGITYVSDQSGSIGIDRTGDTSYRYSFYTHVDNNGSNFYYPALQYLFGYPDLNAANDWTVVESFSVDGNYNNVQLFDTDELTFSYSVRDLGNATPLNDGVDYILKILQSGTDIFNESIGTAITDGDDISLNNYIPKDVNQIDLITDLVKRYGAYFSDNPEKENDIVINTRDVYYEGGVNLDWTDKKDFNSKDDIKLISELQNKEFHFTYKKGNQQFSQTYTDSTAGDIYGIKKVEINNDFTKGIKKIETPFISTPLIYNSPSHVCIIPEINKDYGTGDDTGVLYYGGLINNLSGTWNFEHIVAGVVTQTAQTQYPYAGHFDNPITPKLDINFGSNDYLFYNDLQNRTNATLYNRFWANYINQIDNGKLVTSYFNLNEVDIAYIRNNLNAKIYVKDSYYYISKIVDYNPIDKGLTKVELIKVVEGVGFVQDDSLIGEDFQRSFRVDSSDDNNNLDLGYNSLIKGSNNGIAEGVENSFVLGDNNSIATGIKNAAIIGTDGKTVTQDNEIWIGETKFINGFPEHALSNRIVVNQANVMETLGGVIDSTKEYFLDGIIDMGTTSITVPTTGIYLRGYNFDVSGLISSEDNYTMFVSETALIGSGNMLGVDYSVTTSGTNSKVYELYDATGFNAFEFTRVNYNDCTSLGDLHDYRQGLESGTGRFGGTPTLTLHGNWIGGFRISTSIVRSLDASMLTALFAEGTSFTMQNRFLTDMNIDLPVKGQFLDFKSGNFPNPSTLQLQGCSITRNGVVNANDIDLTPNVSNTDLCSNWDKNIGLKNTFIGGVNTISTETLTTISAINTPTLILGTWTATDLEHFEVNNNWSLKLLGTDPVDFRVSFYFVLEGAQGKEYRILLIKDSGGTLTTEHTQLRTIDRLSGGRDVSYYSGSTVIQMVKNDFLYWEVENISGSQNCTLELDSQFIIEER